MESINGGLPPYKKRRDYHKKHNTIRKGVIEYLIKLNIHDNLDDLYTTCIVINGILGTDEYRVCYKALRKMLRPINMDRKEFTLLKTLTFVKERGSDESGKCSMYDISPEYLGGILMANIKDHSIVMIQKKEAEVKFIELDGRLYKTIEECRKETGLTRYEISKSAVKKVIEGLLYKAPYKDVLTKEHFTVPFEYDKASTNEFFHMMEKDVELAKKVYHLHHPSLMTLISYGSGEMSDELTYTYSEAGRRYVYTENGVNIQNVKSIVRELLFNGFYEIDINTCAPTVLIQMDGGQYDFIEEYIEDKSKYRYAIMEYGFFEGSSKQLINSLFFGASPKAKKSSFREDHKGFNLDELFEDELIGGLMEDVTRLYRSLSDSFRNSAEYRNGKFILTNDAGRMKVFQKWNTKQAIAFMYQGAESLIQDVLIEETDSVLLLHDAVVCKTFPNLEDIISKIKAKTGYDVTLSFKKYDKDNFYKGLE